MRRSPRLDDFDYATPGAYFVTVCARDRAEIFGTVVIDRVCLASIGMVVATCWHEIPSHCPEARTDAFVVMPNHVHGVLWLTVGAGYIRPLPRVVGLFKAAATRGVGQRIWQRSFHERVIRDDRQLEVFRQYIADNPARWSTDPENRRNRPVPEVPGLYGTGSTATSSGGRRRPSRSVRRS